MVLIELGTFQMGSLETERGRDANEGPIHEVTLTRSFYIGKYEITQAQWQAVTGVNPSEESGIGDNLPVYGVSWDDCQSFIEQLNALGLGTFRLPTEAEWEYACRAGSDTRFSFGDALECSDSTSYCALLDEYMWWGGNNTYSGNVDGTKKVGLKLPNPWGLYDMHGSVHEWCSDWWENSSDRGSQVDPQGPSTGSTRVGRGGDFIDNAGDCRSAYRTYDPPDGRYYNSGFRLVRSSP